MSITLMIMKIKKRFLFLLMAIMTVSNLSHAGLWEYLDGCLKRLFSTDIPLDVNLKNYLITCVEGECDEQKFFLLEDITTEKACNECIVRKLFCFSPIELRCLLLNIYTQQRYCPRNKHTLGVLIALLSMVKEGQEFFDSPRFNPNIRLFYAEIERLTKIYNELEHLEKFGKKP